LKPNQPPSPHVARVRVRVFTESERRNGHLMPTKLRTASDVERPLAKRPNRMVPKRVWR